MHVRVSVRAKVLYVVVGLISFLFFWIKINSMPSRDREPGTPVCRCGERYLTELRGTRLLEKWADEVGVKWGWANSGKAMWYLCEGYRESQKTIFS